MARRSFRYAGASLIQGQAFSLVPDARNNEKLERLGFVAPLEKGLKLFACRVCGAEFVTERARERHGRFDHEPAAAPPPPPVKHPEESLDDYQTRVEAYGELLGQLEDSRLDRRIKSEDAEAPLKFDQTAASRL